MLSFSKRNGYSDDIQYETASDTLKNRVFAYFYKQEYAFYDKIQFDNYTTGIEDMMIEMGITYEYPENSICKTDNANKLRDYIVKSEKWYIVYDFIEKYINYKKHNKGNVKTIIDEINRILEEECTAYRVCDCQVVPITSKAELAEIEEAKSTPFTPVNTHISKALSLFADRRHPDYENSIKESISAVESMCCIITGMTGGGATLGAAIRKLKDAGVHIHGAMESAFSSLYGYTSDENGIRHGGIDFTNAPPEDAKYMLVSCSAFVNYLIEKYSKLIND
ncbi:AbiJ-NTD4 domain-containing protein [Ruminococcus sp.]|uniref:AbiJ-NTD4 domain-containing protein n=1 Tax=Ruminococcus sp. TaxID=41978 RepID=UPI0025FECA94|nr:hypothetical protein [Ruminococcus sp.]MBR1432884.1 hypothetical protein [Ruminococcus sp.]